MSDTRPYRRILVGYDGSGNSKRALLKAIDLAREFQSDLRIITAVDTTTYAARLAGQMYPDNLRKIILDDGKALLAEGLSTAKDAGISKVWGSVEEGSPADMLLTSALDAKAGLIVVGRRGIRGIERFLMGSVSNSVVSHSECDVLVVK